MSLPAALGTSFPGSPKKLEHRRGLPKHKKRGPPKSYIKPTVVAHPNAKNVVVPGECCLASDLHVTITHFNLQ